MKELVIVNGNEINKEDLATSFQETVVGILVKKTIKAIKEYNVKQLLVAGGVSANSGLRKALDEACKELNIELLKPGKEDNEDAVKKLKNKTYSPDVIVE